MEMCKFPMKISNPSVGSRCTLPIQNLLEVGVRFQWPFKILMFHNWIYCSKFVTIYVYIRIFIYNSIVYYIWLLNLLPSAQVLGKLNKFTSSTYFYYFFIVFQVLVLDQVTRIRNYITRYQVEKLYNQVVSVEV